LQQMRDGCSTMGEGEEDASVAWPGELVVQQGQVPVVTAEHFETAVEGIGVERLLLPGRVGGQ
jgi:hypothetical protein